MFADATRRIKAARLKGKSEPLIRRGAILLEDALRTASMPGIEQGRLLLIRSVSLGLIYADKSAAVVARQLERQIADLARDAVHGRDPRAASAQAVYFHDRLDAVIVLIQQLARGGSGGGVHTWYWTQAIPGWRPDFTSEEAGRFLLGVLLNLGHGVQFLGQAFQRLVETRCIEVILHAIREQDGPVLMQQCGWDSLGSVPMVRLRLSVDENRIRLPYASRSVLREWVFRWGPSDVRSLWLTMLAVQSWRSETVVSTEVQAQAEVLLRTIIGLSAPSPVPCAVEVQEGPSGNVEPDRMLQIEGSTMAEGLPPAKVGLHDFSMALPGSDLQEWPSRNVELDRPDYSEESEVVEVDCNRHDVPLYTAYAGFWFLIPLLVRVGFGR
ncbi:MAG: hypothetical protein OEY86_02360, partial [Nitrospira sp.]|nr:hypothetical protein [Nitrospira sp.]